MERNHLLAIGIALATLLLTAGCMGGITSSGDSSLISTKGPDIKINNTVEDLEVSIGEAEHFESDLVGEGYKTPITLKNTGKTKITAAIGSEVYGENGAKLTEQSVELFDGYGNYNVGAKIDEPVKPDQPITVNRLYGTNVEKVVLKVRKIQ